VRATILLTAEKTIHSKRVKTTNVPTADSRNDIDVPGESATSITKDLNGPAEAHVGGAEARRSKPSRLEAIALALGVSVATANLSVAPAILSLMLKYGAIIPAVAAGIILALFIAPGILSAWALGRHGLHGYFLGSYALALASAVDKASPEGVALTTIIPLIYIAGIAQSIVE